MAPTGRPGDGCQASWSFLCFPGPLVVFVYTPAKGVGLYFVLQVNFKAQSVFRKVLQDPRQHD